MKIIFSSIVCSFLIYNTAFAHDLGVLKDEQQLKDLVPAAQVEKDLVRSLDRKSTRVMGFPFFFFPYSSFSFFPFFSYPYSSFPFSYPPYSTPTFPSPIPRNSYSGVESAVNLAHTPIVCFSRDSDDHTYGRVDTALNAETTQQAANEECRESGLICAENLGCAFAYGDQN